MTNIPQLPPATLPLSQHAIVPVSQNGTTEGVQLSDLSASLDFSFVVNAAPFLNSGTVENGGTIRAASQTVIGVAGWYNNGTTIVGAELAIGAGLDVSDDGTISSTGTGAKQTITLSGDVTGSGTAGITTQLESITAGGTFGGAGSVITEVVQDDAGRTTTIDARPSGGQVRQTATAGSTVTVTPTLGIENYWINGPASGGTIPAIALAAGSQLGQKMLVNVSNAATGAAWPTTFDGANYSTGLPATAPGSVAGKRDTFMFILNSGTTLWDLEAITPGFSP